MRESRTMTHSFPTELPERPQKTSRSALTKRLTQRLIPQMVKKRGPAIEPPTSSGDSFVMTAIAPSVAVSLDLTYPYALTRRPTSPPGPSVLARSGRDPMRSESTWLTVVPSLALSPSPKGDDPFPLRQALRATSLCEQQQIVYKPKKLTSQNSPPIASKSPLIARPEQSGKLHTTPTESTATALSPQRPITFSSQVIPHHDSSAAARLAGNTIDSTSSLPTMKQEPRLPKDQETDPYRRLPSSLGSAATEPIIIDDESENETTTVSEHSKGSFSAINLFQSRRHKQSHEEDYTRTATQNHKRHSRSISVSSCNSKGRRTHDSSEKKFCPALKAQIVQAEGECSTESPYHTQFTITANTTIQESRDRRVTQHIHKHEDYTYDRSQPLIFEGTRSAALFKPIQPHLSRQKRTALRPKGSIFNRGTREDPIDLDSDTEEPDITDSDTRTRAEDYGVLYGEPMELDQISSDLGTGDEKLPWNINETEDPDAILAALLQAEEDRNRRAPPRTRECAVCGDNFPIAGLPSLANCTHHPETCADCYTAWITTQLQDSSWQAVKCPGSECRITLAYHEIQQYASPEIFQQYDTFIARAAFNEDPNFRWCRNCNFGQIHLGGVAGNIFTCAACGHKACIVHENWHEGDTCEEYEYRSSGQKERDQKAQEEASLQAIGKLSKKCPGKNCVYNIEKNDGCDHMTCSKCRYEFCWICLCNYNSVRRLGNSAHTTDCKYHTKWLV